jgi:predicted acyltransferase
MSELTLAQGPQRLLSLDAHRGFIMAALISNLFAIPLLAAAFGEGTWWGGFLAYEGEHVPWAGCAVWDLIQPSFMFIVGVALPFSYRARKNRGDSEARIFTHVVKRIVLLLLIGLVLRSAGRPYTYFTFEDVVQQIALGYLFLYLMIGRGPKVQGAVAAAVLVGYYLLFALWPLPPADFNAAAAGLPPHWQQFTGYAAHWNLGANPAGHFDQWFLNLFPRGDGPWTFHRGGYVTLSFIPAFVTMLFGLMAGELMQQERPIREKAARLAGWGLAGVAFGFAVDGHLWPFLDWTWSIAPVVKRIWTPSWTLYSAGWVLLTLALFVYVVDIKGYRRWTFPFVVLGANSIAIYVMHETVQSWFADRLNAHFQLTAHLGEAGFGLAQLGGILLLWYAGYWMYKHRVFIRI